MPVEPPPRTPEVFAHPSEAEIARLLDFYQIAWEYEPRSFPLQWDADGRPTQSFTPDFYLPDYDLFLEITTIKPALVNRKNRKIRRLRELYPDVNIKLLALKDMEALLAKYERQGSAGKAGAGQAEKNLSDEERLADPAGDRLASSASPTLSTDLATHQDDPVRIEQ